MTANNGSTGRHALAVRTQKKKKSVKRRFRPLCLVVVALLFALNCVAAITSLTPKRYAVSEGSVSGETILAPRMVEDKATTEAMRQSARNVVPTVYAVDESLADALISDASSFFTAVMSFRNTAAELRLQSAPFETGADGNTYYTDDTRTWNEALPEAELLALTEKLPVPITEAPTGYALLDAQESDIKQLEETVLAKLQVKLRDGVQEAKLDTARSEMVRELQATTLPVRLKAVGESVINAYLKATDVEDVVATTRARENAAADVETVFIPRGSVIVEAGQIVSADQMETLISLDLVKGGNVNRALNIGVILYLFCIYGVLFLYLRIFEPDVYASPRKLLILLLALGITIVVQRLTYLIDPRVMTATFGVLLAAILIGRGAAQMVNLTLAASFALLAGGSGSTLFGTDSVLALSSMLASGQIVILLSEKREKRGSLIASGAVGGVVGALVILAGGMILGYSWNSILVYAGLTMAAALILSVFCVGMLSMWENLFDIITPARLHELSNTNHPLLKKMMTAAPGTYHHSMMTASLAEGAAEAIGANALLARTGAMYHDVGKLRRPLYFKENQTGVNIHDSLPPEESAGFIIAHQKDAENYLARYRMPAEIKRIANEHHGTTLVAYFYYKAKRQEEQDGIPVSERLFRYQGGLPSTRESAVVMLADSCEAAVRSLSDPSKDEIRQMIHRVVQGKIDDGQISQCSLTLNDIAAIEKSFLITFNGLMHERIRYPGTELKE